MANLKVYDWERERWPEFQTVMLDRRAQGRILLALIRHYHTPPVQIHQSHRRGAGSGLGGSYVPAAVVKLGKVARLSTVVHEFTHHLCFTQGESGGWHGRRFRVRLAQVYRYARRYL